MSKTEMSKSKCERAWEKLREGKPSTSPVWADNAQDVYEAGYAAATEDAVGVCNWTDVNTEHDGSRYSNGYHTACADLAAEIGKGEG